MGVPEEADFVTASEESAMTPINGRVKDRSDYNADGRKSRCAARFMQCVHEGVVSSLRAPALIGGIGSDHGPELCGMFS